MPDWLCFADLVGLLVGPALAATLATFLTILARRGERFEDLIHALLHRTFAREAVVGQGRDDVGVPQRLLGGGDRRASVGESGHDRATEVMDAEMRGELVARAKLTKPAVQLRDRRWPAVAPVEDPCICLWPTLVVSKRLLNHLDACGGSVRVALMAIDGVPPHLDELSQLAGVGTKARAFADPSAVTDFMSRTGYSLPVALADLVDNSLDAGATNVEIGTLSVQGRIKYVYISDDGHGIQSISDALSIRQNPENQKSGRLGRYGVGLKAAAFSLGKSIILVSKTSGDAQAACVEIEEYKTEYSYRTLPMAVTEKFSSLVISPEHKTGTAVIVGRLDAMVPGSDNSQSALQDALKACESYLAMVFHRFIQNNRVKLFFASRASATGFPYLYARRELEAVSPFGYSKSGNEDYPLPLLIESDDLIVPVRCHIWPKQGSGKREREKNFDLGGGSVKWQGLYFYRYDRLVQFGGWAGLASIEPHMSLARVEIDLPQGSDSLFRPTITKDSIQNTALITQALQQRPEWTKYRSAAGRVYRSKIPRSIETKSNVAAKAPSQPLIESFRGKLVITEWGRSQLTSSQQEAALQLGRGFLANRPRASIAVNSAEVDRLIRQLLKLSIDE